MYVLIKRFQFSRNSSNPYPTITTKIPEKEKLKIDIYRHGSSRLQAATEPTQKPRNEGFFDAQGSSAIIVARTHRETVD